VANEERITRVTLEQARKMKSLTDWDRVRALTDADIDRVIAEDPDAAPEWTEEEWGNARVMVPVSLHLDAAVIDWFEHQGDGYPAQIADVLRHYVEAQKKQQRG
jgi:uncharacterized protein (DUF4415 family)